MRIYGEYENGPLVVIIMYPQRMVHNMPHKLYPNRCPQDINIRVDRCAIAALKAFYVARYIQ